MKSSSNKIKRESCGRIREGEHRLRGLFNQQNRLLEQEMKKLNKEHRQASKHWDVKQRQFTLSTLARNSKLISKFEERFSEEDDYPTPEARRKSVGVSQFIKETSEKSNGNRRQRSQSMPEVRSNIRSLGVLQTKEKQIQPFTRNLDSTLGSQPKTLNTRTGFSKLPELKEEF